jgi:D-threo-aldose 1-dehydrogenase
MKEITLPHGGVTTQLGFGCTVLKGGAGRAANLALLGAAFDAGIRHYDIAPSYGLGVAEGILGEFIKTRRSTLTVTSKVGLPRPRNPGALARARALLRPLLSFSPALRRKLGKSVQSMSGSSATRFDLPHVRQSVEESLRELGTDYLDVLLLHEITPADVSDELRQYLDDGVRKGMFLSYGAGSYRHQAEAIAHACPDICSMVQTSWTLGDSEIDLGQRKPLLSTHGAVRPLENLSARLLADPALKGQLGAMADVDLDAPGQLADLMLAAAFANNPDGLVLVSTTRAQRLLHNRSIAENADLIARGHRLHEALRQQTSPT